MHLTDHSLRQIDDAYVQSLDVASLRDLSLRLLADLQEARERLNQGPTNSSRPPSSQAPWERGGPPVASPGTAADDEDAAPTEVPAPPAANAAALGAQTDAATLPAAPRKPGKQPGAPGFGRTQVFRAHDTQAHRPTVCAGGGRALPTHGAAVAYTGFQSVDLLWNDPATPGLRLWVIDHHYEEVTCACGHQTRAIPAQGEVDPTLGNVQLREWRLVGPGLATLIVALNLRFRMSRARTQEFLWTWLGVQLSIGTIHQALHEAAAAVAPAEPERIAAIQRSDLLHADETSWPQQGELRWLWVFLTTTTTLYVIANRGKATVTRLLAGFTGWLMTDGWFSYRGYPQRLRCWAHLLRKAQGLVECYDPTGRAFGRLVLGTLETLMVAIDAARDAPPVDGASLDLPRLHAARLAALQPACIANLGHRHDKTQALAVELTNDWAAIFQVLNHPQLPLTNNAAERALRHWVIARAISHGTRTDVGSRVFALLASVIDTCRQRGHSPWPYLAAAITDRRVGRALAPLPLPGV